MNNTSVTVQGFLSGGLSKEEFILFWDILGNQLVNCDAENIPSQEIDAIHDALKLSRTEIIILCYTREYKDKDVEPKEIESKFDLSDVDIDRAGDDLLARKLMFPTNGNIDIMPDAMEKMYKDYRDYNAGMNSSEDAITFLKDEAAKFPGYGLQELAEKIASRFSCFANVPFCKAFLRLSEDAGSKEATGMMALLIDKFIKSGISPYFPHDSDSCMSGISRLLQLGFVTVSTGDDSDSEEKQSGYILSCDVVGQLFAGMPHLFKYDSIMEYCDLIRSGAIHEKQLFYDSSDSMDLLKRIFSPGSYSGIAKRLKDKGEHPGITILLHGPSGTGKTESVYQLARNVHDVLYCDVSRILSRYIGESEKAIRRLFLTYRYLYNMSPADNVPVLLLNEGEALCGKRIDVRSSCDRLENQIINLFLEELEQFDGFLVMTTNLPEAMDNAFMRRFTFKIKLDKPSARTRMKIVRSMIPQLSSRQARMISDMDDFSGGNIANVSKKISLYEAVHGKMPGMKDIQGYCAEENLNTCSAAPRKKIKGFIEYC